MRRVGAAVMNASLVRSPASRFQEAAAPPGEAQLFAWRARALYLGPALNLSAHRNAVAVLALGLDRPFEVADAPGDPASAWRACRSVLIPPDTLHHLKCGDGRMAFLYVDPLSRDLERLRAAARTPRPRAGFDVDVEPAFINLLRPLAEGRQAWADVRPALGRLLSGDEGPDDADPRVRDALARLHANPAARLPLASLAAEAALSPSRFRRLFRAATGVTVRRYRIWIAMGAAVRAISRGEPLTTAALDAGFSSSAHFSGAFREMFGLEPSRLARGRLALA